MIRASLLSLLTLTLAAQDAAKPAPKPAPKAKPAEAAKAADKIIGRVGDHLVRQSEVDAAIAALPPQQQQQLLMVQGAREQYTKSFVEMQLLAAKSRLDGADKTESFKQKAKVALDQILATELLQKEAPALQAKMQMKDDEVKAYYEAHKDKFLTAGKFSARHILVKVKGEQTPEGLSDDEAKAKVAKIQDEFKAGKKFDELAKAYSEDPGSKDKGGLYEDVSFGRFVPEFDQAAKVQELGVVGAPVKTVFGYHLIQVEKRELPQQEAFEAAKDKAKQAATQERQEQVWGAYLAELKKSVPFQFGGEISESSVTLKAPKSGKGGKGGKKSAEAAK